MLIFLVHIIKNHLFCTVVQRKPEPDIMKKTIYFFLAVIILGIIASCTSSRSCAAYGERQRYQIERH